MSKIRAKKGKSKPKAKRVGLVKKASNFHKDTKSHNVKISVVSGISNVLIFEYIVSFGSKYYVSSNMELKGSGIKKVGTGQDHKRGLKTYLMTQTALKKMQNLFGKENTKYIQTDY